MGPPDRGARSATAPLLLRGLPQRGVGRNRNGAQSVGAGSISLGVRCGSTGVGAVDMPPVAASKFSRAATIRRAPNSVVRMARQSTPARVMATRILLPTGRAPRPMPRMPHPRSPNAPLRGSASTRLPPRGRRLLPAPGWNPPQDATPANGPLSTPPPNETPSRGDSRGGRTGVVGDRPRQEPGAELARSRLPQQRPRNRRARVPAGIPGSGQPAPPLTQALPALPCAGSAAVAQGQSTPLVLFARPSGNRWDCTVQIRGKLRAQRPCQSRAKPGSPGRCRGQTDGAFAAFGGMVKGWSRPRTLRGPRKRWRQEGWGREFDSRRRHQIRGHRSPGTGASRQHPGGGAGKETG